MIDPLIAVARTLLRMRLSRRWSLADLSRRSGVNAVTIVAYETDPESLSVQTALRIFRGMPPRPGGEDFLEEPLPEDVPGPREARLREIEAAVCLEEGRFQDALEKLDQALALAAGLDRVAGIHLKRAAVLSEMGLDEQALDALTVAEAHFNPEESPELWVRLLLDRLYLLCERGRFEEAETRLAETVELADQAAGLREQRQARRLAGWIAAGTGRTDEALRILLPVCEELLTAGRPFEAAGLGLDVVALLAAQGRSDDVEAMARQLEPLAEEEKLAPAARTALQVLCWTVRRGTFNAGLGHRLAAEFRRAGRRLVVSHDIPL